MSESLIEIFKALLIKHEGIEQMPYYDTTGNLTIGVGRNLDSNGISEKEALFMLENDIYKTVKSAYAHFKFFHLLNNPRKIAILSMIFNMGVGKVKKFKRMISAIENEDYQQAATQMLDSLWAKQVKGRAVELAQIMESGEMNLKIH